MPDEPTSLSQLDCLLRILLFIIFFCQGHIPVEVVFQWGCFPVRLFSFAVVFLYGWLLVRLFSRKFLIYLLSTLIFDPHFFDVLVSWCPGPGNSLGNPAVPSASKDTESPSNMLCYVILWRANSGNLEHFLFLLSFNQISTPTTLWGRGLGERGGGWWEGGQILTLA